MSVEIRNKTGNKWINAKKLKDITKKTIGYLLNEENYKDWVVSIYFVENKEIQTLNKKFRQSERPTDVLAFSMVEGQDVISPKSPSVLGDIVISLEMTSIQAKENDNSFENELILLLVHGFLHLLSYDDEDKINKKKMVARTNYHLKNLKKIFGSDK